MSKFDDIAETFRSVDAEVRMHLLLDYANKLPPLPERFQAMRDAGVNRVPECMTPVYLFIEKNGDAVAIHFNVAEEAPTVKGLLSIIVGCYNGAVVDELLALPEDILSRLGLSDLIRMNRVVGIAAILRRIKRQAAGIDGTSSTLSRK